MWKKISSFFNSNKRSFKNKVKREKSQIYLREKKGFTKKRTTNKRKKSKQMEIHFDFNPIVLKTIYVGVILACLISILFLIRGDYFSIKNLRIYSPNNVSDVNIAYKSLDKLRGSNLFIANKSDIIVALQRYQPNISYVTIKKELPDTLTVNTFSYPIVAMTQLSESKSFAITSNGIAILKPNNIVEDNLLKISIINDSSNKTKIEEYKNIIDTLDLQKVILLVDSFKTNFLEVVLSDVIYYQIEGEVHIISEGETRFIFDLGENIFKQIQKLAVYNTNTIISDNVYIDLRIPDSIYSCSKESEIQCNKNITNIYPEKTE